MPTPNTEPNETIVPSLKEAIMDALDNGFESSNLDAVLDSVINTRIVEKMNSIETSLLVVKDEIGNSFTFSPTAITPQFVSPSES
jgi:hypothetical protein